VRPHASKSLSPEQRVRRARAAANARHHPDRPELVVDDRRALKADAAERYIRGLVGDDPPLTAEQRGRLARLLQGGGEAA
jgi:hypothetical protein